MKYILFLFFIILSCQSFGQVISYRTSLHSNTTGTNLSMKFTPNRLPVIPDVKGNKLISVRTTNPYFHRTYLINKNGETISSGFMPSAYFRPNDNLIVISGYSDKKDSFNPYGAYDMASMVLFSTFNSFISKLKINKR